LPVDRASLPIPRIAGYEIVSLLGAGGMGTVWRARQFGTRRDVALKLLNDRSMDGRSRARFVREVELASRLQHPDIARVYDTGVHEGSYYYAMELLDGLPLDRYVRERRLDHRGVLTLVRDVCEAVQHAHLKGVIHRDLKPSNILVTHDGRAHVLDFGLAKPITAEGGFEVSDAICAAKGTLAYMAPEQASGPADQVDTRCDVYSLGKVLFQLLTGEPAHPISGTGYEMLRRVVEQEVRKPRDLDRSIHPDVEAVLLKALDRDPRRRYATAGELGRDIDNVLRGEPVFARPTTVTYFLGKKLARHRLTVVGISACVLAMCALAGWSYLRVAHARDAAWAARDRAEIARRDAEVARKEAEAARREAEAARDSAEAARAKAAREARRADATNECLQYMLDALDPKNSHGRGVNNEMMDRANRMLATRFADEPQEEASIRATLGRNMLAIGQFATAEAQLRRAIELMTTGSGAPVQPGSPMLGAMQQLAEVYRERGKVAEACELSQKAVKLCADLDGPAAPQTLNAMNTLAGALNDQGRCDDAENECRLALGLAGNVKGPENIDPNHPDPLVLTLAKTLCRILRDSDDPSKLEDAQTWASRALSARQRLGNPDHPDLADDPDTLESMRELAAILSAEGQQNAAIDLYRRALRDGPGALGPDHPDLVIWRNDLAAALNRRGDKGDYEEAERICNSILPAAMEVRGGEHLYSVILLLDLADALRRQGKKAAAELTFRQADSFAGAALDHLRREPGPLSTQSLRFLDALVIARSAIRDWPGAEQACRDALKLRQDAFGSNRRETLFTALNLGLVLKYEAKPGEARELLDQTLQACQHVLRAGDPLTANVKDALDGLGPARGE
jgi:tetratricopeptide (TPR) repeat protein